MESSLPIENFRNLFNDFLNDLETAFPELKENIQNVSEKTKEFDDDTFVSELMSILEVNKEYIEEESDLFFQNIKDSLLGELNIQSIWTDVLSVNNKESIWKYLQTLLVVGSFIKNTSKNIANLIEKLNDTENNDEIGETIKQQANILGNIFSNVDKETLEKSTESAKNLLSGDNVIMKLAEEMSNDIQSGKSGINPEQMMQNMMKGDTSSMVNMIQHIGSQIQTKITSGEIDQNQLINQAQAMAQSISNDPNISKFAGSMNANGNFDFSKILGSVSNIMGQSGSENSVNPLGAFLGATQGNDDNDMPDLDQLKQNAKDKTRNKKVIDRRRRHKK